MGCPGAGCMRVAGVRLADLVDGGVVPGLFREVEHLLVGPADAVGDGFGEAVWLGPDDLGAEDEPEPAWFGFGVVFADALPEHVFGDGAVEDVIGEAGDIAFAVVWAALVHDGERVPPRQPQQRLLTHAVYGWCGYTHGSAA